MTSKARLSRWGGAFGGWTPMLVVVLLAGAGCMSRQDLREWDRQIKSQPAGEGIMGAVFVKGLIHVLAKYAASDHQVEVARARAAAVTAAMTDAQRESLKSAPLIAVETEPDARAHKEAGASVMIWDTQTQSIVGNNVYDLEPTPEARQHPPEEGAVASAQFSADQYTVQYFGVSKLF